MTANGISSDLSCYDIKRKQVRDVILMK